MTFFPNEIWLEIFLNLDYITLKKCMRVSKTLRGLTEHQSLDAILFRGGKLAVAKRTAHDINDETYDYWVADFLIHPVFDFLNYDASSPSGLRSMYATGNSLMKKYPMLATTVLEELATIPPQLSLVVWFEEGCDTPTRNRSNGATVRDVLKALVKSAAEAFDDWDDQSGDWPFSDCFSMVHGRNTIDGKKAGICCDNEDSMG